MAGLGKHLSTLIIAVVAAAVTAAVMTVGPALATHVGTVQYRRGATITVGSGELGFAQVKCPKVAPRVVGGGFYASGPYTYLNSEWPSGNSSQVDQEGTRFWAMYFGNPGPDPEQVTPYSICVHGGAVFGGSFSKLGAAVEKKL